MSTVTIVIPEGINAGDEFLVLGPDGQELTIACPDGCGAGMELEVTLPEAPEAPPVEAPQSVEVAVPDGCNPGDGFLVDFDGVQFEVVVPDGMAAGSLLMVEVPATPAPQEPLADPEEIAEEIPHKAVEPAAAEAPAQTENKSSKSAMPSFAYGGGSSAMRQVDDSDSDDDDPSLFYWGLGKYEECGDFTMGQLVQVTRSDGTWTYAKIQEYDDMGDTYTVMTKMGPKYMVERADITEDVLINPSDGSCAQQ